MKISFFILLYTQEQDLDTSLKQTLTNFDSLMVSNDYRDSIEQDDAVVNRRVLTASSSEPNLRYTKNRRANSHTFSPSPNNNNREEEENGDDTNSTGGQVYKSMQRGK